MLSEAGLFRHSVAAHPAAVSSNPPTPTVTIAPTPMDDFHSQLRRVEASFQTVYPHETRNHTWELLNSWKHRRPDRTKELANFHAAEAAFDAKRLALQRYNFNRALDELLRTEYNNRYSNTKEMMATLQQLFADFRARHSLVAFEALRNTEKASRDAINREWANMIHEFIIALSASLKAIAAVDRFRAQLKVEIQTELHQRREIEREFRDSVYALARQALTERFEIIRARLIEQERMVRPEIAARWQATREELLAKEVCMKREAQSREKLRDLCEQLQGRETQERAAFTARYVKFMEALRDSEMTNRAIVAKLMLHLAFEAKDRDVISQEEASGRVLLRRSLFKQQECFERYEFERMVHRSMENTIRAEELRERRLLQHRFRTEALQCMETEHRRLLVEEHSTIYRRNLMAALSVRHQLQRERLLGDALTVSELRRLEAAARLIIRQQADRSHTCAEEATLRREIQDAERDRWAFLLSSRDHSQEQSARLEFVTRVVASKEAIRKEELAARRVIESAASKSAVEKAEQEGRRILESQEASPDLSQPAGKHARKAIYHMAVADRHRIQRLDLQRALDDARRLCQKDEAAARKSIEAASWRSRLVTSEQEGRRALLGLESGDARLSIYRLVHVDRHRVCRRQLQNGAEKSRQTILDEERRVWAQLSAFEESERNVAIQKQNDRLRLANVAQKERFQAARAQLESDESGVRSRLLSLRERLLANMKRCDKRGRRRIVVARLLAKRWVFHVRQRRGRLALREAAFANAAALHMTFSHHRARLSLLEAYMTLRRTLTTQFTQSLEALRAQMRKSYEEALQRQRQREAEDAKNAIRAQLRQRALAAYPFIGMSLAEKVKYMSRRPSASDLANAPEKDRKAENHLIVDELYVDGPAYGCGLRIYDVVLSVAGVPVHTLEETRQVMETQHVGQPIEIIYQRQEPNVSKSPAKPWAPLGASTLASQNTSSLVTPVQSLTSSPAKRHLKPTTTQGPLGADDSTTRAGERMVAEGRGGGSDSGATVGQESDDLRPPELHLPDGEASDDSNADGTAWKTYTVYPVARTSRAEFSCLEDLFFDTKTHVKISRDPNPEVIYTKGVRDAAASVRIRKKAGDAPTSSAHPSPRGALMAKSAVKPGNVLMPPSPKVAKLSTVTPSKAVPVSTPATSKAKKSGLLSNFTPPPSAGGSGPGTPAEFSFSDLNHFTFGDQAPTGTSARGSVPASASSPNPKNPRATAPVISSKVVPPPTTHNRVTPTTKPKAR